MTQLAQTTKGAILRMADVGDALVTVAQLTSVSPPTMTRNAVNVTSHDSPGQAMEFKADGVFDPGEISFQGFYIAGSASDDLLIAALTSGELQDIEIVVPAAAGAKEEIAGKAVLTSYGPDGQEVEGVATMAGTLKLSGPLTQGPA